MEFGTLPSLSGGCNSAKTKKAGGSKDRRLLMTKYRNMH
jgi:hypothetical protein